MSKELYDDRHFLDHDCINANLCQVAIKTIQINELPENIELGEN